MSKGFSKSSVGRKIFNGPFWVFLNVLFVATLTNQHVVGN